MLKSLVQFSVKEALIILFGTAMQWLMHRLPNFTALFTQKQVLDMILIRNGKIKKAGKANIIHRISALPNFTVVLRRNTSDHLVFKQIILDEEYRCLIEQVNKHGNSAKIRYIVDAGANTGITALYLLQHFQNAEIIAIEPDKDNYKTLKENIRVNKTCKIKPLYGALWHKQEELTIETAFRGGREWERSVKPRKNNSDTAVQSYTLADIISRFTLPYIDVLKIDIEGAERNVFESGEYAKTFLEKTKFLALEIHNEFKIRRRIFKQLEDNGFEFDEAGEMVFGYHPARLP